MNRRQLFGAAVAAPAIVATAARATVSRDRISCESGDPGEPRYMQLCGDGLRPRIYLDGVEQKDCVTADPGEGTVKRVVLTPAGNVGFNPVTGEIQYETVRGDVRWEAIPDPHRVKKVRAPDGTAKVLPVA